MEQLETKKYSALNEITAKLEKTDMEYLNSKSTWESLKVPPALITTL